MRWKVWTSKMKTLLGDVVAFSFWSTVRKRSERRTRANIGGTQKRKSRCRKWSVERATHYRLRTNSRATSEHLFRCFSRFVSFSPTGNFGLDSRGVVVVMSSSKTLGSYLIRYSKFRVLIRMFPSKSLTDKQPSGPRSEVLKKWRRWIWWSCKWTQRIERS